MLQEKVEESKNPEIEVVKTEEGENIRNITFTKCTDEKSVALEKTIDALFDLGTIDLGSLPAGYLAKLVQLLIAICRADKAQIKNDISIISHMDRDTG